MKFLLIISPFLLVAALMLNAQNSVHDEVISLAEQIHEECNKNLKCPNHPPDLQNNYPELHERQRNLSYKLGSDTKKFTIYMPCGLDCEIKAKGGIGIKLDIKMTR